MALWAPDQSAVEVPILPPGSGVRTLAGSENDAIAEFGGADIIHDSGIWRRHNHRLAAIANKQNIPRIVTTRGMLEPWAMNHKPLKKRIAWSLYQQRDLMSAAYHHATTANEAEGIQRLSLGVPVCVVPNGVDLPESTATLGLGDTPPDTRTALFLGRIYPVKGLPMLIEAWATVRPLGWRLRIVGPDEAGHRAEVERAVREARLADTVSLCGPVEGRAKARELEAADLFILPSHSESFGMVVAEALSYAVPVLTTTAVPWPELSQHDCGWRVNPEATAIASGIRVATALDRSALRAKGENGRALMARDYKWSATASRLVSVYRSLLQG